MSARNRLDLMVNGSGTGSQFEWRGGDGVFSATGTFGGGNVALQFQDPNGSWLPLNHDCTTTPIALTAAGMAYFRAPICQMRAVATTATAVYAYATSIPED